MTYERQESKALVIRVALISDSCRYAPPASDLHSDPEGPRPIVPLQVTNARNGPRCSMRTFVARYGVSAVEMLIG